MPPTLCVAELSAPCPQVATAVAVPHRESWPWSLAGWNRLAQLTIRLCCSRSCLMGPLGPLVLAVARDLHPRGRGLDDGRKFVHVLPPCSQPFKEWLLRSSFNE